MKSCQFAHKNQKVAFPCARDLEKPWKGELGLADTGGREAGIVLYRID